MNTYVKKFLVSFVAGAGSALGAAVANSCYKIAQNKAKEIDEKRKSKVDETVVFESGEGS